MVVIGVIFILFLGVYLIYSQKNGEVLHSQQELREREECLQLATAFVNVFVLGENAEITVAISYEMSVQPQQQRIQMENTFCIFPVSTVAHDGSSDPFTLQAGAITVKNKNGVVIA